MIELLDYEGGKILLDITNPSSDKAVILSHGFMSNKNKPLMVKVAQALSREGINAVRFNYGTEDINERVIKLREVLKHVSAKAGQVGLFGTSLGGMISIIVSVDQRVKSLALVNPVYDQISAIKNYLRVRKIALSAFKDKLEREFFNYDLPLLVKSSGKPLFVISGSRDRIIPVSVSRQLYKDATGKKKFMLLRDCGHVVWKKKHLVLVSEAVAKWFLETLS